MLAYRGHGDVAQRNPAMELRIHRDPGVRRVRAIDNGEARKPIGGDGRVELPGVLNWRHVGDPS